MIETDFKGDKYTDADYATPHISQGFKMSLDISYIFITIKENKVLCNMIICPVFLEVYKRINLISKLHNDS